MVPYWIGHPSLSSNVVHNASTSFVRTMTSQLSAGPPEPSEAVQRYLRGDCACEQAATAAGNSSFIRESRRSRGLSRLLKTLARLATRRQAQRESAPRRPAVLCRVVLRTQRHFGEVADLIIRSDLRWAPSTILPAASMTYDTVVSAVDRRPSLNGRQGRSVRIPSECQQGFCRDMLGCGMARVAGRGYTRTCRFPALTSRCETI